MLALAIYCAGCRSSNPLSGWKGVGYFQDSEFLDAISGHPRSPFRGEPLKTLPPLPQAMTNDCVKFIQELSTVKTGPFSDFHQSCYINSVSLLSDGTGQWAISIEALADHTYRYYILIYDKTGRRVKTIKRSGGSYSC